MLEIILHGTQGFVGICNEGFPSENQLLTQILLVSNLFLHCPIILKFCTEHGNITAVLCAKFLNSWATGKDVMDKQDLSLIH